MQAKTISLSAQKGGVAKSTSSITISAYLARQGFKVLIIDLDGQCNTTGILLKDYNQLKEAQTVAVMIDKDFEGRGIEVVYPTQVENLDIIPSHPRLSEAETIINNLDARESRLKFLIEDLKKEYDFIIIDCPPNINMLPINAWTASDYIIIPIQPSVFDLQGLNLMSSKIESVKKYYNPQIEVLGYLMTLFDQRNSISHEVQKLLIKTFGDKVFNIKIPINTAVQKAHANKIDIFGFDPKSNAALAYKTLVDKELLPRLKLSKKLNTTL